MCGIGICLPLAETLSGNSCASIEFGDARATLLTRAEAVGISITIPTHVDIAAEPDGEFAVLFLQGGSSIFVEELKKTLREDLGMKPETKVKRTVKRKKKALPKSNLKARDVPRTAYIPKRPGTTKPKKD